MTEIPVSIRNPTCDLYYGDKNIQPTTEVAVRLIKI